MKSGFFFKKLIFTKAVFFAVMFSAQEIQADIDTVIIRGRTKIRKELDEFKKHAQSSEVLSEYDLNRNSATFLDQTLGTVAGVQVERRTAVGGQRIVIRGYGNDQKFNNWGVKMYLNNFPITNADGITVLEDIDFSLINHIDIVKGPASTLYGGGVGGTIRFYTKPRKELGISLSQNLLGGSYNTLQAATRIDAVSEKTSSLFNYNHFQSRGYRPYGNSNKNQYTFAGNFKLSKKQILEIYAAHNNSFEGVPGQISYADYEAGIDNGNLAYIRKNAGNRFVTNRFSVGQQWKLNDYLENKTHLFYGSMEIDRKAAGAFENTISPTYGFRSVFSFDKNFHENLKNHIEFGAEYIITKALTSNYRYTGTNPNIPDEVSTMGKNSYFKYHNTTGSFFAINRLTFQPWELAFISGISLNQTGYNRSDLLALPGLVTNHKDQSFQKKFNPVYAPHFALQKTVRNHVFNISYSEGYNTPTAATAFIPGTSTSNDQLKTEHAKMLDFSVKGLFADTKLDYQIAVFSMNISDKLTQLSAGNYSYWANTGSQKNNGLELNLGYAEEWVSGFVHRIEPYFNFSHYRFKYRDFKTFSSGNFQDFSNKNVVGIPKNKISFGLDVFTFSGVYLLNTFNYFGNVYSDFSNSNEIRGFHQLNARLGYKKSFGKIDVDAYILANNLTHQKNYTFLFLGNNTGDNDPDSQYPPNVATDITPGPQKAYFFGGLHLKYNF